MSVSSSLEGHRGLLEGLERREQERGGGSRPDARARLARKMGVLPGTLFNLAYDRLKRLDENLRTRLTDHAVKDLEREVERLTHELAVARALAAPQDPEVVRRLKAVLSEAQALLAEAAPHDGDVA